jgi:purine-binding chemotaxis protein CheW
MEEPMSTEAAVKVAGINHMVGFTVGKEEFGLDIMKVREIIRMVDITRIPNAPSFVQGIISLRGVVIPVIDFKKRFCIGEERECKESDKRIVVVVIRDKTMGLIVDKVTHVVKLDAGQIFPPPEILKDDNRDYIGGIGQLGEKLLIILNAEELVGKEELPEIDLAA